MNRKGHPQAKVADALMQVIAVIIGIGATAVIIAGAVVAAVASRDVAVTTGIVSDPALAWLIPIIIEGGCATSLGLASRRTMTGQDAWRELLAAFVLLLLAATVNMYHAGWGPEWLASVLPPILAASPPLIMAATVEMVLRSVRVETKKTRKAATSKGSTTAPVTRTTAKVASNPRTKTEKPVSVKDKSASADDAPEPRRSKSPNLERVRALYDENPNIKGKQAADALGISASQANRLLVRVREENSQEAA